MSHQVNIALIAASEMTYFSGWSFPFADCKAVWFHLGLPVYFSERSSKQIIAVSKRQIREGKDNLFCL